MLASLDGGLQSSITSVRKILIAGLQLTQNIGKMLVILSTIPNRDIRPVIVAVILPKEVKYVLTHIHAIELVEAQIAR